MHPSKVRAAAGVLLGLATGTGTAVARRLHLETLGYPGPARRRRDRYYY